MEKLFILASNNEDKLREFKEKLKEFGIGVISQKEAGYDIEVNETGTTFKENAVLKAEAIYKLSKMPTIADDSGLEVDYLDGAPGVYSKRFAGENASSEDRYKKILELMRSAENRKAKFKCAICFIDSSGNEEVFEGECEGKITDEPRGNDGFGYDPIFEFQGKTFAEMSAKEKNEISHRGRAIKMFVEFLRNNKI